MPLQEIDKIKLEDILEKVVGELKDWIIIGDELGKIIYANDAVYNACNITKEEILGEDMCMFVGIDLTDNVILQHVQDFIHHGENFEFVTNRFIKDNKRVYLANSLTTVWDETRLQYYVCISKDITSNENLKEEIYKANYLDPLTNYPNQKVFVESMSKEVKKANRTGEKLGIILIDVKKLSEINNIYGLSIGELVIKEVGKRIKYLLVNTQEIFKFSETTFAIIQQLSSGVEEIEAFFDELREVLKQPIKIHNSLLNVDYKAGIALCPDNSINACELVEMAQVALAKANKMEDYSSCVFYSVGLHEEVKNHLLCEKELQLAVQNDEFIVYFQPFVDLKDQHLVGMEALVRRRKSNGEIISPGAFIDQLEKLHLIEKVGMIVLEKVCAQIRLWLNKDYKVVPVSVNLSALQFKNPNLAKNIKDTLRKYDVPTSYIGLEITETTILEDVGITRLIIEELRADGFSISIDDFGTGYASIGYLRKFMFDHLKIDISFIKEIVKNAQDRSIVEAIIFIAKTLNLKTIAEGIEDVEQMSLISSMGCEMGQGFFWDRPISAAEIENKYFIGANNKD